MAFWLSVVVLQVFGLPGAASAQQSFSGRAADPLDGSCVNVRDVSINWRDGTVSPATFSTSDDVIDIGGSPIPIKWLDLTGTHSYAVAGTYDVLVNYRTTCLNGSGEAYEFNAVNKPGFRVSAIGSSPPPPAGPPPPDSCPPGQAASLVRISQVSCPIQYTPALGKAEKKIFRQLAGIAYKGYVVDKAIDDVVSFPGKVVSEGFFGKNAAADLVIGKFWGDFLERLVAGKGAKGLFGKGACLGLDPERAEVRELARLRQVRGADPARRPIRPTPTSPHSRRRRSCAVCAGRRVRSASATGARQGCTSLS